MEEVINAYKILVGKHEWKTNSVPTHVMLKRIFGTLTHEVT